MLRQAIAERIKSPVPTDPSAASTSIQHRDQGIALIKHNIMQSMSRDRKLDQSQTNFTIKMSYINREDCLNYVMAQFRQGGYQCTFQSKPSGPSINVTIDLIMPAQPSLSSVAHFLNAMVLPPMPVLVMSDSSVASTYIRDRNQTIALIKHYIMQSVSRDRELDPSQTNFTIKMGLPNTEDYFNQAITQFRQKGYLCTLKQSKPPHRSIINITICIITSAEPSPASVMSCPSTIVLPHSSVVSTASTYSSTAPVVIPPSLLPGTLPPYTPAPGSVMSSCPSTRVPPHGSVTSTTSSTCTGPVIPQWALPRPSVRW